MSKKAAYFMKYIIKNEYISCPITKTEKYATGQN